MMVDRTPVLYFAPRTCARVSLTALEELGIPFETQVIAFMAGEHRKPDYLAINPSGKVPALKAGEGVVVQTGAILNYLAETRPEKGLLPKRETAIGRAAVLADLFRCSSDLHPLVTRFVMSPMISTDADAAAGIRRKASQALGAQLEPFEQRLGGQNWCLEEGWSAIDSYLAWIWFRITDSGFDPSPFPLIAAHFERASARPSAQAALRHEMRAERDLEARGLLFRAPHAGSGKPREPEAITKG